jgi:hypothetical protein
MGGPTLLPVLERCASLKPGVTCRRRRRAETDAKERKGHAVDQIMSCDRHGIDGVASFRDSVAGETSTCCASGRGQTRSRRTATWTCSATPAYGMKPSARAFTSSLLRGRFEPDRNKRTCCARRSASASASAIGEASVSETAIYSPFWRNFAGDSDWREDAAHKPILLSICWASCRFLPKRQTGACSSIELNFR